MIDLAALAATRSPSTVGLLRWFDHSHLREGYVRVISARFGELAEQLVTALPDSAELSAGLRKLLESKDCAVRAAIAAGPVPSSAS